MAQRNPIANCCERGAGSPAVGNDSAEHRRWELELRSLLGMGLIATEGYGSTSAAQNFTRAAEVIAALSDPFAGTPFTISAVVVTTKETGG